MSPLPRVTEITRERIAREFDSLGPDACMAEIAQDLRQNNPELLDMALKCAKDIGNPAKIMLGFGMFYRLLVAEWPGAGREPILYPLPRISPETRDSIVKHIDEAGSEAFTMASIEALDRDNPELLQMAHSFASRHADYLGVMQGFALLYESLAAQAAVDRNSLQ